jgi:hypothetical protein
MKKTITFLGVTVDYTLDGKLIKILNISRGLDSGEFKYIMAEIRRRENIQNKGGEL